MSVASLIVMHYIDIHVNWEKFKCTVNLPHIRNINRLETPSFDNFKLRVMTIWS